MDLLELTQGEALELEGLSCTWESLPSRVRLAPNATQARVPWVPGPPLA